MFEALIEFLSAPWVRIVGSIALLLIAAVLCVVALAFLKASWQIGKVHKHAPELLDPDEPTMAIHGDAKGDRYVFGRRISDARMARIMHY